MLELLINPARNVDEPLRCHAAEVAKPPIHRDGILILEMFDHHVQCFHKGSAWSVIRRKPSSFQPSTPPIIFRTFRPNIASWSAARSAPLQCGPAQQTTNKTSGGYPTRFPSLIRRYGRLMAPGR